MLATQLARGPSSESNESNPAHWREKYRTKISRRQIQKTARPLEPVRPPLRLFLPTATSAVARMSTSTPDAAGTAGIPVELEPAAGLSSASSCIKLSLLGSTFRPVYLHQVFPDERIPGWRPTAEAEMEARATADRIRNEVNPQNTDSSHMLPHSSYSHHRENDPRLEISIELSPDCTTCVATAQQTEAMPSETSSPGANDNDGDDSGNAAAAGATKKRPIIDTTNSNAGNYNTEAASPDAKRQKLSVSFADHQGDGSASTLVNNAATSSPENKMNVKDIIFSLRKALPNLTESSSINDGSTLNDGYLQQPLGRVLSEYKRTVQGNNTTEAEAKSDDIEAEFVITLADGSDKMVADYHNKIQGMAMFFIETADNVDLSSHEGGGHWKCIYVYRRHEAGKYSLVGYTTLFHFNSPFRKPKPGIVMRVCQAIVLPPYQRGGHGSMMLNEVYKIAEGRSGVEGSTTSGSDEIVEVNVEDPCPGFVALRNKVDFRRFQNSSNLGGLQSISTDIDSNAFWSPLPEDLVASGAAELRVTPQQILIASEMSRLCAVEAKIEGLRSSNETSSNEETIEGMEKKYRLMVKKRLLKLHREELGARGSKDEQKAKLSEIYDDTLREYRSLLKLK